MKKTLNKIADLKKRILFLPKRAQEACLWHMENLVNCQKIGPEYDKEVGTLFDVIQTSYFKKAHLTQKSVQAKNICAQIHEEVNSFTELNRTQQKQMIRFFHGSHKKDKSVLAKNITILVDTSRG